MTVAMCGLYVLAWTTYAIVAFTYYYFIPFYKVTLWVAAWAPFSAKIANSLNPFVYFYSIKNFVKKFSHSALVALGKDLIKCLVLVNVFPKETICLKRQ
jgi:hypothetical protein